VVIAAVLRIGVHSGIEVVPPSTLNMVPGSPEVQAGIELALVAHVAELFTNVTYSPQAQECKLDVVQSTTLLWVLSLAHLWKPMYLFLE
jgi:hypothetical protein